MKRTLRLRRESLAELTAGELGDVAGGHRYTNDVITCPVVTCLTLGVTCLTCLCE